MIAFIKLSPVLLLAGMMMASGFGFWDLDILVIAPLAAVYAAIIAAVLDKFSFNDIVDTAVENVEEMQLVFFILMLAYALAEAFMSTGVGASIINIALGFGMTARTVAVTAFLVSAVLSVATGTSWGTYAAAAPIFLWLNHIVGGDPSLVIGAIAGGSVFGDNIGLISDTTVVSSGIQEVEVTDRIRTQGVWSVACLAIAAIIFFVVGLNQPNEIGSASEAIAQIPADVWEVLEQENAAAIDLLTQVQEGGIPIYMVIPLIVVVGSALAGIPTLACLGLGLVFAFILGTIAGTTGPMHFLGLMESGFIDAGGWVIIMMMWVGAFGGIMAMMNAFQPLSDLVIKMANSVRQLMFLNGILSLIGNMALSDEMAQIVTIGPIIKTITDDNVVASEEEMYTLRLRNATFSDALGVYGSQFIPWHVYIAFFMGIANSIYPLFEFTPANLMRHNYMAMIAIVSILGLTLTGLDRFVPLFGLPQEPDVYLTKHADRYEKK